MSEPSPILNVNQLKGTTMKALFKTITIAGSLALAVPLVAPTPAVAQMAPCSKWEVNNSWVAIQGRYRIRFDLRQQGSIVSGTASYFDLPGGFGTPFAGNHRGSVKGVLAGDYVTLNTSWGGLYTGRIDTSGRIAGTTYDVNRPWSNALWHSDRPMNCPSRTASVASPLSPLPAAPVRLDSDLAPTPVHVQSKAKGGSVGAIFATPRLVPDSAPPAPAPAAVPTPGSTRSDCKPGYVFRKAGLSDRVCVAPQSAARVAQENRSAQERIQPGGGAYGPNTCRLGFVWREAFPADLVCVTPEIRALVAEENRIGPSLRVR
jgi:hypothetical protein